MLHTKNFGLLEFALQLEPTAVGLRAAAGARAQSSFLSETRGSQISPPIRTGRDDERSPACQGPVIGTVRPELARARLDQGELGGCEGARPLSGVSVSALHEAPLA